MPNLTENLMSFSDFRLKVAKKDIGDDNWETFKPS